jgi:hypothetical protein
MPDCVSLGKPVVLGVAVVEEVVFRSVDAHRNIDRRGPDLAGYFPQTLPNVPNDIRKSSTHRQQSVASRIN